MWLQKGETLSGIRKQFTFQLHQILETQAEALKNNDVVLVPFSTFQRGDFGFQNICGKKGNSPFAMVHDKNSIEIA